MLILANKIDKIPEAKVNEVQESLISALAPAQLFAGRPWRVARCSAKSGRIEDITEGFSWLASNLTENDGSSSY